jgi:hypothetical protein
MCTSLHAVCTKVPVDGSRNFNVLVHWRCLCMRIDGCCCCCVVAVVVLYWWATPNHSLKMGRACQAGYDHAPAEPILSTFRVRYILFVFVYDCSFLFACACSYFTKAASLFQCMSTPYACSWHHECGKVLNRFLNDVVALAKGKFDVTQ